MHLKRFAADGVEHFADLSFRQGHGERRIVPAFVESCQGIEDRGAGQLNFPEEVRRAVL